MLNLLNSDLYKLLRRKSFYICGLIVGALGVIGVLLLNNMINSDFGIDAQTLGFNGIQSMSSAMSEITLLITIFMSIFIPSEFTFGTIKNIASKGRSRAEIYLSKLIMGIFVTITYTLFAAIVGFTAGSIMWGTGEFTNEVTLNILRMIGLFILAEIALQSIYTMVGFLVRHTGGAVAINLGIIIAFPVLTSFIDFALNHWFKIEFEASKYWVSTYTNSFLNLEIAHDVINTGIWVSLAYLVISTFIGIITFQKRDIK